MTYDLRLDVPGRAYINAQLLSLLEHGGTLQDAKNRLFSSEPYSRTFTEAAIRAYKPYDHSLAIALLFCIVVVPREFLDLPADHQVYKDFETQKLLELFSISEPHAINPYTFVRCLRNSVAHALFSITEPQGVVRYEFWTDRPPVFRATISHQNLITFMNSAGKWLTNVALSRK